MSSSLFLFARMGPATFAAAARRIPLAAVALAALLGAAAATAGPGPDAANVGDRLPDTAAPATLAFRVAKVVVLDDGDTIVDDAVVLVKDGKIERVGPASQVAIPAGYRVLEFGERWLVPGLVDGHNHTAGSLGDLNDMVYQSNPGLDTRVTIEPENSLIKKARTGGVTTVMLIPGSGTNMSGFGTVCKTAGKAPDEVIVRSPGSLKIAQAGNPEWYMGGNGRSFMNWNTRQTLLKARAYHEKWLAYEAAVAAGKPAEKPDFDPIWDNFRALFQRKYPATVHTQIYQVVLATLTLLPAEMKVWTVTDHSTFDAWKLASVANATDAFTICGPRAFHFDTTARRMIGVAVGWAKNGRPNLGINTDAPVIPQEELSYQSTMGCWYGWLPYDALKGVTSAPARSLGLFDRLGSIEAGKDADFGIWTGDPIDPRSACLMLIVNGKIAYDGTNVRRRF